VRALNERDRVDPVPEVNAAVEIESSQVVAHGLVKIAMRAIDLRVRRIDMVLLGNPASQANYFAGHLSRVGAPRQPVQERFGCQKRSCVGQRLRVLNARLRRPHITLKQTIRQ
jgi:hypothetical protein